MTVATTPFEDLTLSVTERGGSNDGAGVRPGPELQPGRGADDGRAVRCARRHGRDGTAWSGVPGANETHHVAPPGDAVVLTSAWQGFSLATRV